MSISGLAAAYKLKSQGLGVTVFEAEERAGGKIKSSSQDGLIWDEGANTMTESEIEVGRLIDNLGLRGKQQLPISQNKRYIVRNGIPELIPSNPVALIKSNFFSAKSKLQIILEPLLWRRSDAKRNFSKVSSEHLHESVGNFFQRHFGKEVVDYLIDPFVAGTSGGDPESLSMPFAFPELWHLEKRFGSVIVGAIRSKLSGKKEEKEEKKGYSGRRNRQRGSFSFQGGMQTLIDILCKELGNDNLKLKSKVLSLSYNHDGNLLNNWSISFTTSHPKRKDLSLDQYFDAVIMTAPLCDAKEIKITKRGNPFVLDFLPKVSYLPLSVIITSYKKENVKRPLEGFGVLVPSKEQENGFKTLGTLFSSMMFPDRAPSDQYLYTTFIGGSRNRDLAKASLHDLLPVVTSDLRKLLGAEGHPTFVKHVYWSNAFPLYSHDYGTVIKAIDEMEKGLPGFFYAGNHRDGLSVGKAIASGCKAADLVISYLDSSDNKVFSDTSLGK
ncbi:flavin containing amine oxidoreductase family isoform X2 [Tasmannia lanceolata]|uniref:flavin containing amine oxidoreductase family isoform X2 n=1 Tax=Tasmannia lanceolata TaxID=3420 RepID=UPI00406297A1